MCLPLHTCKGCFCDVVIKLKHLPRYWPFARGIHRSQGQCRGALTFSLIWAWTSGWVNNLDTGDLIRHRAHYDVTVIVPWDLLWEYRTEFIAIEIPCVIFAIPTMIFCRGVLGFVTGFPCGVWGRGLTTCPLFGQFFSKHIPNKLVCKFKRMDNIFIKWIYIL